MELVIFVGLPGAGKTTCYRERFAATHAHVSKDLLRGARERRQQELIALALTAGHSVVVDNTNVSVEARAPLIALGRRYGARVIAWWFDVPLAECLARNRLREGRARVPDVAVVTMARRLVPPSAAEGFDEVVRIAAVDPIRGR